MYLLSVLQSDKTAIHIGCERNKITHQYSSFHYCYERQEWKELSLVTTYGK